jgi:hypothetical protein
LKIITKRLYLLYDTVIKPIEKQHEGMDREMTNTSLKYLMLIVVVVLSMIAGTLSEKSMSLALLSTSAILEGSL